MDRQKNIVGLARAYITLICMLCFLFLLGCQGNRITTLTTSTDLPRSTPEEQATSSAQILSFIDELNRINQEAYENNARDETGFHSLMILRNGLVIAEGWWNPYAPERKHRLFSLSKSFTSTAIGFAVKEGRLKLDDRVVSFFPEAQPQYVDKKLQAMTIRHLLMMSTGQESESRQSDDWVKTFLSIPVEHEPGAVFKYNTQATFMLSAILQRKTGKSLMAYLKPRLFEPLGIEDAHWLKSPQGYDTGGFGLNVKTEDIAKFGQLYLDEGQWQGEQLLPASWIQEATAFQIENAPNASEEEKAKSDWAQGYGFQFWRTRNNAYRGDGAFGQYAIVIPELDVVIAATAGSTNMQRMLNLIWEHLYPAFKQAPLPADQENLQKLRNRLAELTLLPANRSSTPAIAQSISGKTFNVQDNALGINKFNLELTDNNCSFTLSVGANNHHVTCGLNSWVEGDAKGPFIPGTRFAYLAPDSLPVAASGRWRSPSTFELMLRFVEAPDHFIFTATFENDKVTIKRGGYAMFEGSGEISMEGSLAG